jgi:hypothetical protein
VHWCCGGAVRDSRRHSARLHLLVRPPAPNPRLTHTFLSAVLLAVVADRTFARCGRSISDRLMRAINDLRLEWASSEDAELVHRRTFPLQCTL